jgi:hypothetical protein
MPTCTTGSLNVACFRGYNLTRLQRIAYKIWYAANELASNGGTDYTGRLTIPVGGVSLLNSMRQQFGQYQWSRDNMDEAELAIYYNNAIAVGALVSNVPNVVQPKVRRLEQINEDDLVKMLIFLECALGAHRSPPL